MIRQASWAKSSRILLGLFLLGVTLAGAGCKKKRDIFQNSYMAPFKDVANGSGVVFLSSIEGYVEPCGCTSNPLGGLARFATVFSDLKLALKDKISLIDAGNTLFESLERNEADKCQDDERINLLLSTMKDFGLKYTISGNYDDGRGLKYRDEVLSKHGISQLESVDQFSGEKASSFAQFLNDDIALIGIKETALEPTKIKEKIRALTKAIKETKKPKAIIAISQMPEAKTKEIFTDLNLVDVVIEGQVGAMMPKTPARLGTGPIYLEGGRQGQNFTVLIFENLSKRGEKPLTLDTRAFEKNEREDLLSTRIASLKEQLGSADKNRLTFIKSRLNIAESELSKLKSESMPALTEASVAFHAIALTKKIEPEASVKSKLLAYEKSIPALVKKCEENIECPKAEPGAATYVGVETCKNCHAQAYEVWKAAVVKSTSLNEQGKEFSRTVGHSRAWQTLKDVNKDADRSCIGCHSIGFMEKGGYCKAFEVDFRKDVQCESCHGAGSLHAASGDKKFIQRAVPEETCRGCHHVPHIQSYESFNYQEQVMKILGPGHGEKLLKELQHVPKS